MPDFGPSAARYKYVIYGVVVESELRLTSVETCAEERAPAAIGIAFGSEDYFRQKAQGLPHDPDDWIRHAVLADGSVYMRVDGVFEATVSADGRSVVCSPLGDIDDRTFEANLVNFALSASLTLQGEECLHATVVSLAGRAFGLIGPSGAGKSTLAAFLVGQGAELITDDMLRVTFAENSALAYPGPYRLKVFHDTALRFLPGAARDGSFNRFSEKVMVRPDAAVPARRAPLPLAALFWLDGPEPPASSPDISAKRLAGNDVVKVLAGCTMNRRYFASDRLVRQLSFVEQMGRTLPVYSLEYHRDYALLDRVADEIRRMLGA